ncbi:MAG: hypothetical protein LBJ12_03670, partial [Oscillospiraceae bacterium]|nr:hypothetical protein [Oscillospiraceae bacterium]
DVYGLNFEYQYIRNGGRVLRLTVFNSALVPIYDEEYSRYTNCQQNNLINNQKSKGWQNIWH